MHATFSIHVLGIPRLVRADGVAVQLRRRPRLLLFYVAAHTDAISRDRLCALLWPDYAPDAARQLLRTALHQIKQACGDVLESDQQRVQLRPLVWVDVRMLATLHAGAASLDELVKHPPGDFLADLDTGDVDAIEHWLYAERSRWQRRLADLFFQHAQFYVHQNQLPQAQHVVRIAHHYEPLREDIVQLAMQLAYRCSDRASAIALYEQLHRALDDQLGVPPLPATTAIYHAIVTDTYTIEITAADTRSVSGTHAHEPFIGRQAELIACHGVGWDGRLIVISGTAGIGKTRLASEYLRRSNALIIHATAFDGDQHLPYHVLTAAIRAVFQQPAQQHMLTSPVLAPIWQQELRRLWPELPGGDPDSITLGNGESRLIEAIALLLLHLGKHRRLVIFCDDAQWFDDATLHALTELVRRTLAIQWQIVLTLRPSTLHTGMQRLLTYAHRTQQLTRITLEPLNSQESQQLAQLIDPNYDDGALARAEGNPFMVIELLRQRIPTTNYLPEAIRDIIATRLSRLSANAQRFSESAAICGREFDITQCATLADLTDAELPEIIDELQHHGVIRLVDAVHARFDHPLTVESIVAQLGALRTSTLHRRFAEMLALHVPPDYAQIANHLHLAGADALALPYAKAAAQHAHQLGALQESMRFMQIAIAGSPVAHHSELWYELGDMLSWGGDWHAAAHAFEQAIATDHSLDGDISDHAQLGIIKTYLPQARYDEVIAVAEPLSTHPHPRIAMDAAFVCGTAYSLAGIRLDLAWQYLTMAEQLCRQHTAHEVLPRLLFEQGSVLAQQGDIASAIARYRDALSATEHVPAHHGRTWAIFAHNNLAYHLHLLQQYDEATRHVRTGIRIAQRTGMQIIQSYLFSTSGEIALAQGDIDGAERHFREGLEIAERFGLPERMAGLHANLGLVARAREDIPLAIRQLTDAMHEADTLGIQHLAAQIRIWLASITPTEQAITYLTTAEQLARHGGRTLLLSQIMTLKQRHHIAQ